jgi:hypothetical protein
MGATMEGMGITDKAKELADLALEKAGTYSEKATELAGKARENAPSYVDRAAELAGKAVEATAAGVDKATQGRFHDKIETASEKVGETLDRARAAGGTKDGNTKDGDTIVDAAVVEDVVAPSEPVVTGEPPITPATTNPDEAAKG